MQEQEQLTPIEELKQTILEVLSTGSHEIVFEKKDKTIRTLKGTREFNQIPEEKRPKTNSVNKGNSVPVFDEEKGEWRAFGLTSLISINGTDYRPMITESLQKESESKTLNE